MSVALEDATNALREHLLKGVFTPDAKLREVIVAEELGVSRTLARLAMSALEHEGLLSREANRGSRVRRFSIDEITDAIEVRGELEAMAVRKTAERGLTAEDEAALTSILTSFESILTCGVSTEADRDTWRALNKQFHDRLIASSGNWAIRASIDQMSHLPLVASTALIFESANTETGQRQLTSAHEDHVVIFTAVRDRQGQRAEARMREHAYRSAANKRLNLIDPDAMARARSLPGGALIAWPD